MSTAFNSNSMPSLQNGDTIAIISTARKISVQEIEFGVNWLKDLGFNVVLGKTIGAEHHQFAGTDALRTNDLQSMILDPKVKAIWCARGGYGTVRIIDNVDFSPLKTHPKWVIGYSDITVLHSHLHKYGLSTVHAPMAFDIKKASKKAQKRLNDILLGKSTPISFPSTQKNVEGEAKGVAVGGNLSILYSLCGSKSAIDTKGKILFLEDLDEYLYHIDRMLQNLDRNSIFANLKGLVIGGMNGMHDNTIPFGITVEAMILKITSKYNYPVVFQAPFGHVADNRPIIFGKELCLKVSKSTVTIIQ